MSSTETKTAPARPPFPPDLVYYSGFGNHFSSEAIAGALPRGQNSPLICPYALYAEQISGTSFTSPRKHNQRSWLYRVKPSVTHEPFRPKLPDNSKLVSEFDRSNSSATPTQLRWKPVEVPDSPTDFVDGLYTVCGAGSSYLRHGFAIHMYAANKSMDNYAFCSADGDFLIVPQKGRLWITTECGRLQVSPGEIVVVPQGFRYAIDLPDGPSRGYVAEIFGTHFELPDLGPIGANGLASSRDFLVPEAWFEHVPCPGFTIVQKILANRQSAQRSRVRKLQYISELERSVTTLQTEVSALSPRVAFLDHQRLLLNVDNSALKQRIAALAQDKIFKDAHQEALKREIERLRNIFNEQNMKNEGGGEGGAAPPLRKRSCTAEE